MKYVITAMNVKRDGYQVHTWDDGDITRDEIIDTEDNILFEGMTEPWEIEDRYEEYWNRLNDGYNNREIVKVLNVIPIKEIK